MSDRDTRSTDVPASLAGYFYQLLVASRELLFLLNDQDATDKDGVGIEKGSDVRIFKANGTCIETKFYKDKQFNKNHQTLRHTIYNFYKNYKDSIKNSAPIPRYVYITNVPISTKDKIFFENWPRTVCGLYPEYEQYILDSIVGEAICKEKQYKQRFNQFKQTVGGKLKDEQYKKILFEKLHQNPDLYGEYCELLKPEQLMQFVTLLTFKFADKYSSKWDTIQDLKNDTKILLRDYNNTLNDQDCDNILFHIIDSLFVTTVQSGRQYVDLSDVKNLIANNEFHQRKYYDKERYHDALAAIDEEINILIDYLRTEYKGSRADDILHTFLDLVEKLYSEFDESGNNLEDILRNYSMNNHGLTVRSITALLRPLSILAVFLHRDPKHIKLSGSQSIRNFYLSSDEPYILKDASSFLSKRQVISEFVRQTLDQAKDLDYGLKVVFGTHLKPCLLNQEDLYMVMNIAEVSVNEEYYDLYSSLAYKCTTCLHPQETDDCIYANVCKFIQGDCK